MKTLSLLLLILCPFLLEAQVRSGPNLVSLNQILSPQDTARVVAVIGVNGQSQPSHWRVLVRNSENGVLKELTVRGNTVVEQRFLPRHAGQDIPTVPLRLGTLEVTAAEAFRIADDQAIQAGVGFDRVNYQLRWRGNDREPTWLATLIDQNGQVAGQVIISAISGKVVHRVFHRSNAKITTARRKTQLPIIKPKTSIWSASKKKQNSE